MSWFNHIIVSIGALVSSLLGNAHHVATLSPSATSTVQNQAIDQTVSVASSSALADYVYFESSPANLTDVRLSQQGVEVSSPWGKEESYKVSPDGGIGWHTFSNGVRVAVILDKLSPQEELKQSGFSSTSQAQYEEVLKFIGSKIGANFSGYDYEKFLHETTQQTANSATSVSDKIGYGKVLIIKSVTSFGPRDSVFRFSNDNGIKGFIWLPPESEIPSKVDFWGSNGWQYSLIFPAKQDVTKRDVDAVIRSLKLYGQTASAGTATDEIKDCGTDMECLIAAAPVCGPAKAVWASSVEFFGKSVAFTDDISIAKGTSGKCALSLIVIDEKVDGQPAPQEVSQGFLHMKKVCQYSPADLKSTLTNWKSGNISSSDDQLGNCKSVSI
jgi:hypothetical protein